MKLLLDQNLSPRLVTKLEKIYPGTNHVANLGLDQARDAKVWEYARLNGFAIVSKDSDFSELALLRGFPPKIIWIGRGNCSTQEIESILRRDKDLILGMEQDEAHGTLLLY